jgi:hypothetical protein
MNTARVPHDLNTNEKGGLFIIDGIPSLRRRIHVFGLTAHCWSWLVSSKVTTARSVFDLVFAVSGRLDYECRNSLP